jgi:hypothetical protein
LSAIADGAFGVGREHGVEVGGGRNARRNVKARKLSCVLACFGIRRHPYAGQLEPGIVDQLRQRVPADVSGADRRDFDCHALAFL